MVESRQNPAAVIPICDDDDEDDDGYTTANDYFASEPEDVAQECPQLRNSKRPSRKDSDKSHVKLCIPALTDPIRLERRNSSQDIKKKNTGVGIVSTLLDLLKGFRVGSDVTKLQLPPQFNLPKSQLQVYGEAVYCCAQDYLGMCADGATPVERLLAVVRFHLSTTRPAPFLKAPYNPILGEVHHVSVGELNVICEQVSLPTSLQILVANSYGKRLLLISNSDPNLACSSAGFSSSTRVSIVCYQRSEAH